LFCCTELHNLLSLGNLWQLDNGQGKQPAVMCLAVEDGSQDVDETLPRGTGFLDAETILETPSQSLGGKKNWKSNIERSVAYIGKSLLEPIKCSTVRHSYKIEVWV
jgi:hypothetical protein